MWREWKLGWYVAGRYMLFVILASVAWIPTIVVKLFCEWLSSTGLRPLAIPLLLLVGIVNGPLALAFAARSTGYFLNPIQPSPPGWWGKAVDPETGIVVETDRPPEGNESF